ncbi:transcription termination/antitermination protein NusA [Flavobacterium alvei]|uniref:Transcription termination/antitermination protein NusA n=1 Tax=Flavobacterium alvei TaxID=2080416 RepID=A0A2S5ACG7_9FLAO|nr:transcription termination factor NusA [Flavobacterium alvei]POY40235.1 transcription termination/antitermination protein NusA [Flavobacterium alvei]HQE34492.1 transcription termination factor NusA [Flavobacterium alvei]HQK39416.1 transcription termination factor NusA [Flavobacterium alvei]
MENLALIDSFSEFKDDKLIDRVTLMAILEDVFRNALKKKFGSDDNFDIIINPDKGDMEIWQRRVIVADDDLDLEHLEITLSDARKIEPDFEIGEEVSEEVKLIDLGRRAILALRQNLISKIHEHDNTNLYKQFKDLIGEIYTAEVHHVRPRVVILIDDEGNEIVLPKEKQIPSDFFRKGDNVRGIIESVELKGNKPQIIMSRTSEKFLEKLFEQEIPEVFDGLIIVKNVVRIPGEKAKVAVDSYDDRIDPVGACVGMKGSRIHGIVRELGNENIDVINYTSNIQLYITRALSPAKVSSIKINEDTKRAEVFLKLEEVSKAIGRGGHNIKLAGQLTGYELDVIREGDVAGTVADEDDVELTEFSDEIEEWVIEEFAKIGLDTAKSILKQDVDDLVRRTDLEEETILDVMKILKEEFDS